jgi:hypothetical protein
MFTAPEISNFSPHLIRMPVRMDVRSTTVKVAANFAYLVNSDGTMAVLNMVKDQKLLGWSLFETDGFFEDVAVLNGKEAYVTVRRVINGATVRYLEKLDPDYNVDCGIRKTRTGLVNGDFANGLTGWTPVLTGAGAAVVDGGVLQLRAASGTARVDQAITLEAIPYELLFDVLALDVPNPTVRVTVGTTPGGNNLADVISGIGLDGVLPFTGVAGTVYIGFWHHGQPVGVDNVKLLANRWTGLGVLNAKSATVIVDNAPVENALVIGGILDASRQGDSLETGLFFAPVVECLPPVVADNNGNNVISDYTRLVGVDMKLLNTPEVIVQANGQQYRPPMRRFNTDVLNAPLQPYTGWKGCSLGGVAKDARVTITQDSPVPFELLAVNISVGI